MQRFRFSLETLLDLRRRKEEEVKLALAAKRGQIRKERQAMADMGEQLARMQQEQKEKRATTMDVASMRHAVAYRHKLKLDMLAEGRLIQALQQEAEDIRQQLIKATQQVRALELLRERRFEEWRKQYKAEEQGIIDDVSQQGFIRKKREAAIRENS